jgi:hypothetical protein
MSFDSPQTLLYRRVKRYRIRIKALFLLTIENGAKNRAIFLAHVQWWLFVAFLVALLLDPSGSPRKI